MTLASDETERLREAFASTLGAVVLLDECLSADDVLAAVREELPPAELRRVLGHVATCPVCTEAWRLAEVLEDETGAQAEHSAPPARFAWKKAAGLAAAAAVVVVVGLVVQRQGPVPEPTTRTAGARELALEVGTEPLPRDECILRWTAFEGARYDVIVSTQDLDTLSKAVDLAQPEYRVPAEHLALRPHLPRADLDTGLAGEPLLVYIEAHRPGEGTVASGTFSFTVR